jgi:hypothetical protein
VRRALFGMQSATAWKRWWLWLLQPFCVHCDANSTVPQGMALPEDFSWQAVEQWLRQGGAGGEVLLVFENTEDVLLHDKCTEVGPCCAPVCVVSCFMLRCIALCHAVVRGGAVLCCAFLRSCAGTVHGTLPNNSDEADSGRDVFCLQAIGRHQGRYLQPPTRF